MGCSFEIQAFTAILPQKKAGTSTQFCVDAY